MKEEVGDVTILFNNAGVMTTGSVLDLTDDQIERTFQVNVLAHFWVRVKLPDVVQKLRENSKAFNDRAFFYITMITLLLNTRVHIMG